MYAFVAFVACLAVAVHGKRKRDTGFVLLFKKERERERSIGKKIKPILLKF